MISELSDTVSGDQFLSVFVILLLIGYFLYKEWPEFKKRMSHRAVKEEIENLNDLSNNERLQAIEGRLDEIDGKLMRDYTRLNRIETDTEKHRRMEMESLEEREVIMKALLGALGGLQELGANGPTRQAEQEIREYLNKKAHRPGV